VARIVNLSWHRVHAICSRYVELALASADLSDVTMVNRPGFVGDRRVWRYAARAESTRFRL